MSDFNYQEYLRNNPLLKEEVKEEKLLTESQEVEELAVDRTGKAKTTDAFPRAGQYGIGDAVLDLFKKLKKENLSEDKYDDLVAGDDDIPADKKADAAKALRMLDKGASYEKVKHLLEDEEIQEQDLTTATLTKINAEVKNVQTMAQAILDFIAQVQEKESVDFGANASMKIVLDKLNTLAKTEEKEPEAVAESEEVTEEVTEETSSKMKVSELKAKIKEDILSILSEQDEEEDVEVDVEDEVEVDTEEPALDAVGGGNEGLSSDEKEIQDSLKIAYDNAVAIGDTKLADQIGNSITFFTRTHVVER